MNQIDYLTASRTNPRATRSSITPGRHRRRSAVQELEELLHDRRVERCVGANGASNLWLGSGPTSGAIPSSKRWAKTRSRSCPSAVRLPPKHRLYLQLDLLTVDNSCGCRNCRPTLTFRHAGSRTSYNLTQCSIRSKRWGKGSGPIIQNRRITSQRMAEGHPLRLSANPHDRRQKP